MALGRLWVALVLNPISPVARTNIERAVQICIDIASHVSSMNRLQPKSSGESFRLLADNGMLDADLATAMIKAVGFRNVSVHDYVKVDWVIVMKIAEDGVDDLKAFGRWAKDLCSDTAPPHRGGDNSKIEHPTAHR